MATYTAAGFSKISDYCRCPHYYYLRWRRNLESRRASAAPTFGVLFHAAREAWYKSEKNLPEAINAIHAHAVDYIGKIDDIGDIALRVAEAMAQYANAYQADNLEHTALEVDFETTIGGFPITGRLDGVCIVSNLVLIDELKTTGITPQRFIPTMHTDGKSTCYVWAARKLTGADVAGLHLDIVYKKPRNSGFEFARDVSPRSEDMLKRWEDSTIATLSRLAESDAMLQKLGDGGAATAFPHYWHTCHNLYGTCPYVDLCKYGENPAMMEALFTVRGAEGEETPDAP